MPRKSAAKGDEKSAADRDQGGRFQPGCSPGPGRLRRQIEEEYQWAFNKALPPGKLSAVVSVVLKQALGGNITAARLLIEQSCGRPSIRVTVDEEREDYRVAGATPAENQKARVEVLRELLEKRLQHEALLREQTAAPVKPRRPKAPKPRPPASPRPLESGDLESRIRHSGGRSHGPPM